MNVTIVSPFRDSSAYVADYIKRVDDLCFNGALRVVCVEGDSVDDTRLQLLAWSAAWPNAQVIVCDTHKPHYGSVVNAERFEVLATVFNAGLEAVDCDWSDYVLFLPSDIKYEPNLIERLAAAQKDVIAPFTWMGGDTFYDTWAFQMHGRSLWNFPRYMLDQFPSEPFEMDTVGGTMLIDSVVLRAGVRYRIEDVDRGFCNQAREHGFRVWADPTTHVVH